MNRLTALSALCFGDNDSLSHIIIEAESTAICNLTVLTVNPDGLVVLCSVKDTLYENLKTFTV